PTQPGLPPLAPTGPHYRLPRAPKGFQREGGLPPPQKVRPHRSSLHLRRVWVMPMDRRQKTIHYSRVVHLSHVVHPSIPCWPGDPPVQLETAARWEQDGFFLQRLALGE